MDADVEDDTTTPDSALAEDELNTDLMDAMKELTEKERVCFVLKHLEQWRLKEIAEELDTNISSTKQDLFRAIKKLRVSMAGLRSVG